MLTCDVRESEKTFWPQFDSEGKHIGGCDRREFLKVGTNWSYDFRIEFPFRSGEEPRSLKFERKRFPDYIGSFLADDKLTRQLSYVDALVLEFNPTDVAQTLMRYEGDPRDPVGRAMKRLSRLTADEGQFANLWVLFSMSPKMTLELLRFIESGKATRPPKVPSTKRTTK